MQYNYFTNPPSFALISKFVCILSSKSMIENYNCDNKEGIYEVPLNLFDHKTI